MSRFMGLPLLVAFFSTVCACVMDFPDEEQEGKFKCETDRDCKSGYFCGDGFCSSEMGDGGQDGGDGGGGEGDYVGDKIECRPRITLSGDVIFHEDKYEINYGSVSVGVPVTRNMIIRNSGDANLEVTTVNTDQDPQQEFSIDPAVPPTLLIEPGEDETLTITYDAKDGLSDNAVAIVFSNDPFDSEVHVQLIGEFNGEERIDLVPGALDFGDVPLNQTPTLPVVISNQGTDNAVLRVDSVATESQIATAYEVVLIDPSDYQVTPPFYLNSGDFVRADVTFTPPARGTYEGDLIIESSDENASPSTVALRGRAGTPAIVVTPESIQFGQVPANTQAPDKLVTIRNDGAGDLIVSSIDLAVGSSPDISLDGLPAFPLTLPPGDDETVTVRYFPTSVGTDVATIIIQHDDPDRQPDVRVDIAGEGIQGNAKPNAVIKTNGQDTALITVLMNDRVDLDGQDSFDTDGTVNAYEWRIVEQPSVHPCGQVSTMSGTTNPVTFILPREAGITTVGLKVKDDLEVWSDEDLLEIHVGVKPEADVRVGDNFTGYIEVDMGDTVTFNGGFSSDCDGIVDEYQWSWGLVPPGRGGNPTIGEGSDFASVLFDYPGMYAIQLVVEDDDEISSDPGEFDVLVKGPKAFRITADWFDQGNDDHYVDVDLHLLKPGSTNLCSSEDCYPTKPGGAHPSCDDNGNTNPNWGILGSPVYQRDSWEDSDGSNPPNPSNPADEINFPNPGMGAFRIYVTFRCHASAMVSGNYLCCDDMCTIGCPLCVPCDDTCVRRAVGTVQVFVTDYYNNETLQATLGFSFDAEEHYQYRHLGTLSWPDGNFQ